MRGPAQHSIVSPVDYVTLSVLADYSRESLVHPLDYSTLAITVVLTTATDSLIYRGSRQAYG